MGHLSAKDEGTQFFKHVPHFRDFTRSSGTFSLKLRTLTFVYDVIGTYEAKIVILSHFSLKNVHFQVFMPSSS